MTGRDPIKVTIGGVEFKVRPLTVTQIETIENILAKPHTSQARRASEIVAAGISRDYADHDIEDAGATVVELGETMQAILQLGGFVPPGEAKAAAERPAQIGEKLVGASRQLSPKRRPR